ncbi:hypothetical protein EG328_001389 [Venturia inaequalis]|uniref:Uncharacterized protein n=1 Tax=Venturia inaequalis TaxID=5025 RepID=A0A8H3UZT8_VENIN|nr:hypothetical protein EG328_001389 [Venturia inaequalis]
MASKAIPSHLKPPGAGNGEAAEFARKHHGKSQSHMRRQYWSNEGTGQLSSCTSGSSPEAYGTNTEIMGCHYHLHSNTTVDTGIW